MKIELTNGILAQHIHHRASYEDKYLKRLETLVHDRFVHYQTTQSLLDRRDLQAVYPHHEAMNLSAPERAFVEKSQKSFKRRRLWAYTRNYSLLILLFLSSAAGIWYIKHQQKLEEEALANDRLYKLYAFSEQVQRANSEEDLHQLKQEASQLQEAELSNQKSREALEEKGVQITTTPPITVDTTWIRGQIRDLQNSPIADLPVEVEGRHAYTDAQGFFELPVQTKLQTLDFRLHSSAHLTHHYPLPNRDQRLYFVIERP